MKMKQYAVWEMDGDTGYWALYDSLKEAVEASGDGARVYRFDAKFVGRFKRKSVLVRLKTRRKGKGKNHG